MRPDFLSCDWGTSSFRLRLVSEGQVIATVRESVGVRELFERGDGPAGFAFYLSNKLTELANGRKISPQPPLVISGMASSSIGWKELPYAPAPFGIDGEKLIVEKLEWPAPAWLGPTYLVSGVATATDMMRGEESQIVGLFASEELKRHREDSLVILTGSHSKHASVKAGMVVDFHTYVTGELFHALSTHTILQATVGSTDFIAQFPEDFLLGVQATEAQGMPRSLFQARSRGVLNGKKKEQNAAFLSGVLIASELLDQPRTQRPVIVVGTPILCGLYQMAMLSLHGIQAITVTENNTVVGHERILARLK